MNTSQLKLLSWGAGGLLAAGLSGYLALFIQNLDAHRAPVPKEDMERVLEDVLEIEREAAQIVAYADIKRTIIQMGWTGKQVIEAPVEVEDTEPKVATDRPIAELVRVLMIVVDAREASQSFCILGYDPTTSGVVLESLHHGLRRVGESLHAPHDYARIAAIRAEGVEFAFDDEAREHELLAPMEFETGGTVVVVAPGQAVLPVTRPWGSRPGQDPPPLETYEIRPNHFRIGTEDAAYIGENYTDILARDVETARHRDPRTGRYDGIEVQRVAPGSQAAKHGLTEGDVIKSINDHPVNSVQQAIKFVEANKNMYKEWKVVIENKGLERTVYYRSPE